MLIWSVKAWLNRSGKQGSLYYWFHGWNVQREDWARTDWYRAQRHRGWRRAPTESQRAERSPLFPNSWWSLGTAESKLRGHGAAKDNSFNFQLSSLTVQYKLVRNHHALTSKTSHSTCSCPTVVAEKPSYFSKTCSEFFYFHTYV